MVKYNSREWFSLIFKFHKSDTFRILGSSMFLLGLYAWLIAYIEIEAFPIDTKNTTVLHTLLGFVLSLLLVFRTNTAYERWWEGRKAWGELVNNSRNLCLKIQTLSTISSEEKAALGTLIYNYVYALKDHLKNVNHVNRLENIEGISPEEVEGISHLPNFIMSKIYSKFNWLYKEGTLSGEQLLFVGGELKSFTDVCGICERIKSTPIPYSYSLFLKKFLFVYVMSLPIGFVSVFGYWVIAVEMFIFYALVSLELIAEEIEDPFGNDSNDLPIEEIASRIKKNIKEILNYHSL